MCPVRPTTEDDAGWGMVSRTAAYAVQAVVFIASRAGARPVAVVEIAHALTVPEKYLARVMNTLARRSTLTSTRGARGGFQLARSADDLTLAEIVAPFDPIGEPPQCLLRNVRCGVGGQCSAHNAWYGVADTVRKFFQVTTVADLIRDVRVETGSVPLSETTMETLQCQMN